MATDNAGDRDRARRLFAIRAEQRAERESVLSIRTDIEELALRMTGRVEELTAMGHSREAAKVSAVIGILIGASAVMGRLNEEIRKHG